MYEILNLIAFRPFRSFRFFVLEIYFLWMGWFFVKKSPRYRIGMLNLQSSFFSLVCNHTTLHSPPRGSRVVNPSKRNTINYGIVFHSRSQDFTGRSLSERVLIDATILMNSLLITTLHLIMNTSKQNINEFQH
jgi:hypothetical protein